MSNNIHKGLSSSADLLPKPLFRWTLWIVNVFTLVLNVLVMYGRMFNTHRDENQAINFVIRNLAGSVFVASLPEVNITIRKGKT